MIDHKPLLALFGPCKPIPGLAANRLPHWALLLSQLQPFYSIIDLKLIQHFICFSSSLFS